MHNAVRVALEAVCWLTVSVRLLALVFIPRVLDWHPLLAVLARPTGEVIGALSALSTRPEGMVPVVIVAALSRTLLDAAQFALFRWHLQSRAATLVFRYPVMVRWLNTDGAAKASLWLTLGLSVTPVVAFAAVSKASGRMFIAVCMLGALLWCTAYAWVGYALGGEVRSVLDWLRERQVGYVGAALLGLTVWLGVAWLRGIKPWGDR